MDLYLRRKTAVVTGASQGIGRAIAMEFAMEGVKVFAIGRNESLLESLVEEIAASGAVKPVVLVQDFLSQDAPEKIAAAALANLGNIDILVNNVGRSQPLDIIGPDALWAESLTLEFDRPRQLTQLLLPQFIKRKEGSILNIISTYELRSVNASAVAKTAIATWSKQLAGQLGQHGIRINCLQPGLIDTENIRRFFPPEERRKFSESEIPLGDFGEPQDMASIATFLVSPRAKYITGTVTVVDGGMRRHAF
jgi:3-oxoacyl-[acyl-carrier protein] reductase